LTAMVGRVGKRYVAEVVVVIMGVFAIAEVVVLVVIDVVP
jgi:hypothetical protein